ncbi:MULTISPECIES: DUF4084 domain-containing protein [Bacillaceae]|uniref:DUF4084 domain-containing protein n=1 Tax=Bacillaceae TaxID=186817 RepID=UPI001E5A3EA9|nr:MULTISPECIES: DUF4084 domain-containing protein [Bacillaceae]MCE4049856.1 DUF4084 domain-containing protein [Bacillus sp. Au-Bac7]MDL0435424.1 DUF4084 domain-containing protein [Niallia sp. SS-2023]UPO87612.1 DUF4084 domain-containing protein [Niallia sp. Man26]
MERQNTIPLLSFTFTLLITVIYYIWLYLFQENQSVLTWGANILCVLGSCAASLWLLHAAKRSEQPVKTFWYLLFIGNMSYMLSEVSWFFQENILKQEIPFPSFLDVLYFIQVLAFFGAFLYHLSLVKRKLQVARFLFDVAILMTVAFTFSWHFIISPIINSAQMSHFALAITLAYPIGDLAVLAGVILVLFGPKSFLSGQSIFFILTGLIIYILADSWYFYLQYHDSYQSGDFVDPLFLLGTLLVGFTGNLYRNAPQKKIEVRKSNFMQRDVLRTAMPYVNVIILFIFMITNSEGMDALTIGTSVSILLVLLRQILIITENRRLVNSLYEQTEKAELNKQHYQSLFDYHPDAAFSMDLDGNFVSVNNAGTRMLGMANENIKGLASTTFLMSKEDEILKHYEKVRKGIPQVYEVAINSQYGHGYYSITNIPIVVKNKIVGIFGIGRDITAFKKNEAKIQFLAFHDPLTGLANRARFESYLLEAIEKAQERKEQLAVIFVDLDKFKSINDTLGHDIGDKLLLSVASRIKNSLPLADLAARQGGDEFTIVLKETTKESAEQYVKELLKSLKLPHDINGHQLISTPSIGVALYPDHGTTSVELMKKADTAMYQVKENGKGCYLFYSDAAKAYTRKLLLEKDMPYALENKEFFLHYQPLMDLSAGKITGTEALIRWKHPQLGLLLPGEFIPIAEESGFIHKLGAWVLMEACKQAKKWHDKGYYLKMGVNLSPKQFYQENLLTNVEQALAISKLDSSFLDLEITEQTAINNLQAVLPKLHALKALGVTISIDDFGTGYSSLSYLAEFPINTVKIAKEFINKLEENKSKETIISSIVDLAQNLNLDVLAEGVEEVNQALLLKSINCHAMQGYLFGRPCGSSEMEDLLNRQPDLSISD